MAPQQPKSTSMSTASPLLNLPRELQIKIFSYVCIPWSLAICLNYDPQQFDSDEEIVLLKHFGDLHISGPPGSNLVMSCQKIHPFVADLQKQMFTGKIIVDCLDEHHWTDVPNSFRRWYEQCHTLRSRYPHSLHDFEVILAQGFGGLQVINTPIYCDPSSSEPYTKFWTGEDDELFLQEMCKILTRLKTSRCVGKSGRSNRVDCEEMILKAVSFDDEDYTTHPPYMGDIWRGITVKFANNSTQVLARVVHTIDEIYYWHTGMEKHEVEVELSDIWGSSAQLSPYIRWAYDVFPVKY